jgi:tetratricopeptide (TPR) repeat protein
MHTETMDRQAFEFVAKAMEQIDEYNHDHRLSYLKDAESVLTQAITRDSQYLDASLYAGIVKDLIGKPADAIPFFDAILSSLPKDSESRRDEVQYSRGVAWYHQYSHRKLAQAEPDFLAVVNSSQDKGLRLLARAGLAQTYAMWMIPNTTQKEHLLTTKGTTELEFIKEKRDKCLEQIDLANTEKLPRFGFKRSKKLGSPLSVSIQGTLLNARGMCTMYWTDYNVRELNKRSDLLQDAIRYLEEADTYLPGDWANTCDLGSAHFRLAVVIRESGGAPDSEFKKALDLFQEVIDDLRPNYGFAFYEMGRICRVWQRFDDAKAYFGKSLSIPQEYRDAGDNTVKYELDRAERSDSSFP